AANWIATPSYMEPLDLVPKGYRFLTMAEELVVDYLANWIADTCRLCRRLRHRAVESSWH
ncbi:hypothetical protein GW17_00058114, partial [Ensete ventricosum]